MNLLLYLGIVFYMFLSTTVAAKMGIERVGSASSFILIALFINKIIEHDIGVLISRFKEEFFVILVATIIIILKYLLDDYSAIQQVLFFLIIPVFVSILLATQDRSTNKIVANIIIVFFILECLLAIYEKLYVVNIFPYVEEISENFGTEFSGFRSSAFLGHPLANAVCVSTIMGFILASPIKLTHKILFIILGYISLLCFNARGAILVWTFLGVIYLIDILRSRKTKILTSVLIIIFSILSFYFIRDLVVNFGFGGRLFQGELMDESAMTRIDVFDAFLYINNTDLWLGNPSNYVPIMEELGAGGVENSYVVIIINYGIVMSVVLFIAYFFWIKKLISTYSTYNRFIIITSFLILGSMNNALAGSTCWIFFILCANSFSPFNKSLIKSEKKDFFLIHAENSI